MRVAGAKRNEPVSGVSEKALFIGLDRARMFCVTYRPPAVPRAGVVICCPLLSEQLKIYRTEVLAARALAAEGFAVLRFHYRGTGHSGGVAEDVTVETMLADVARASEYLREMAQVNNLVFCGARWGGLVAGLAAGERPGASLILWEPVLDGQRYFRETFRASQMSALATGGTSLMTVDQALAELREAGRTDTLGHPVHLELYDSARTRNLIDAAAGGTRAALLVQVSRRSILKPEFAALKSAFETGGSVVETAFIEGDAAWSFVHSRSPSPQLFIEVTLAWLNRVFPAAAS